MSPNSPHPVPPLQQKNDLLIISLQQPNERPQKPESIKREISTIALQHLIGKIIHKHKSELIQVLERGDPVDSESKPPASTGPFPMEPPHPSPTAPPPG